MQSIGEIFLQSAITRLHYYKSLADQTIQRLDDAQLYFQPNAESNSIAIIIQHMSGNMISRWTNFLNTDGEKEWRKRDDEFESHILSKDALVSIWENGWQCCFSALQTLTTSDLLKTITIRQEPLTVIDAINRQLAHYPYHTGQIIYVGKMILQDKWVSLSIEKKRK